MSTSVKTIWYGRLEAARRKNATYVPDPFSTLNEKFEILKGENLGANEMPEPAILVIGRGGHRNVTGTNNASLTDALTHRITDACLFEHIPFIMRPVANDLTAIERERYRFRRLEVHGGISYFVYYGKVLSVPTAPGAIELITVVDKDVVTGTYTPSAQQLNPVPVTLVNGEINYASGQYLAVRQLIDEQLSLTDITEIINACQIIYSDKRYANVTEMAIASAFDVNRTTTEGGVSVTYKEAKASQCLTFLEADYALNSLNAAINLKINVGNTLPYLV